jgi:hypothetical protein
MSQTTDWLIGQHLIDVTITPLQLGAYGALTPMASSNVVGQADSVVPEFRSDVEDIRSVNDPQINEVPLSWGFDLRVTLVMKGSTRNYLNWLMMNCRYCRVSWTAGCETYISYHVIKGWSGGVRNRGKNTEEITLGPIKVVDVPQMDISNT